jgi:hypothetical protein
MARAKVIAVTVAAAIAFSSATATAGMMLPPAVHHVSKSNPWVPWAIIGCATFLVLTAMVANARDNRQLISPEAWTCGLAYWLKLQVR